MLMGHLNKIEFKIVLSKINYKSQIYLEILICSSADVCLQRIAQPTSNPGFATA